MRPIYHAHLLGEAGCPVFLCFPNLMRGERNKEERVLRNIMKKMEEPELR